MGNDDDEEKVTLTTERTTTAREGGGGGGGVQGGGGTEQRRRCVAVLILVVAAVAIIFALLLLRLDEVDGGGASTSVVGGTTVVGTESGSAPNNTTGGNQQKGQIIIPPSSSKLLPEAASLLKEYYYHEGGEEEEEEKDGMVLQSMIERYFGNFTTTAYCATNSTDKKQKKKYVLVFHKMGTVLMQDYVNQKLIPADRSFFFGGNGRNSAPKPYYPNVKGEEDFRALMLVRNVYDALVSGYQYHKSGYECWKDVDGRPIKYSWIPDDNWCRSLSYELNPPPENRSLCQYLADVPEKVGIRAYTDFIFRSSDYNGDKNYYAQMLNNLAWAAKTPYFNERTLVVCYENLTSSLEAASRTVANALQFFQTSENNDGEEDQLLASISKKNKKIEAIIGYHGSHSSGYSHDPELRRRLTQIVREVDTEHYDGDIAWIDSFLIKCRSSWSSVLP